MGSSDGVEPLAGPRGDKASIRADLGDAQSMRERRVWGGAGRGPWGSAGLGVVLSMRERRPWGSAEFGEAQSMRDRRVWGNAEFGVAQSMVDTAQFRVKQSFADSGLLT